MRHKLPTAISLNAVSEAPTSEELGVGTLCGGRFRYSDLKEAALAGLWGLYMDEPVLIVCEVAVAVGALQFPLVMAERMVVGQHVGESGAHNNKCLLRNTRHRTSVLRTGWDEAEGDTVVAMRRSAGLQSEKHFRTINVKWIGQWGLFSRCGSSKNHRIPGV